MTEGQWSDNLVQAVLRVLQEGPDRVLVNAEGEAVSSARARERSVRPTVLFVRDDGWSLGTPEQYRGVAEKLWHDHWVAKLVWDGHKWVLHRL